MWRLLTLAGLCVVLAALAGCGGADSDSTAAETTSADSSGGPLTKAEFIEQADAICAEYLPEAEELEDKGQVLGGEIEDGSDQAREELADLLSQAADSAERQYDQLRALRPPADDAELIDSMLSIAISRTGMTREAVDAIRSSDLTALREIDDRASDAKLEGRAIAHGYGFEVCGTSGE